MSDQDASKQSELNSQKDLSSKELNELMERLRLKIEKEVKTSASKPQPNSSVNSKQPHKTLEEESWSKEDKARARGYRYGPDTDNTMADNLNYD